MVAATEAPVIFWGEPGSGRHTLALALHALSPRAASPLQRLRADDSEQPIATGSTLLLEGLTDLPDSTQDRLIETLDQLHDLDHTGPRAAPRVLTVATDAPMALVDEGELREELYYRLGVFVIAVPPLRERLSDIDAIADHVLRVSNRRHRLTVAGLHDTTVDRLRAAAWPGNVPELRRAVEHAAIRARTGWIHIHHLPAELRDPDPGPPARLILPIGITAADAERRLILATLEHTGFNKSETARRLGVDVKTVRNKLKSYGDATPPRRRSDPTPSPGRQH